MAKTPRILVVKPSLAQEWLENNNNRNRPLMNHVVEKYARDMLAEPSRWVFTGDPIQFDINGDLLNGQHRLNAVIKSGQAQKFLVVEGLETESQDAMDDNAVRRVGQQLHMHGIKNGPQTAAIVRVLLKWETGAINKKAIFSTGEIKSFIVDNEPRLTEAMHWYYSIGGNIPMSRAAIGAFVYKLLEHSEEHPQFTSQEDVLNFLGKMESGADLDSGNPILTLRNTVLRQRNAKMQRRYDRDVYALVRTWNAYASGERYAKLQGPRDGVVLPSHLILKHMKD